jgi:hypothetical protein
MKQRFFDAYYFSMNPTGVEEIDKILSALCLAGKGYHHTQDWNEDKDDWEDYSGGSYAQWIQSAANEAAEEIKKLRDAK